MNRVSYKIVFFALAVFGGFVLTGISQAYAHDASVNNVIWQLQNSGTNVALHSVHFINENVGWVVGESGTILRTTNGGANWQLQTSGTLQELWSVQFMDDSTGWVSGYQGTILKTTDGTARGFKWVQVYISTA